MRFKPGHLVAAGAVVGVLGIGGAGYAVRANEHHDTINDDALHYSAVNVDPFNVDAVNINTIDHCALDDRARECPVEQWWWAEHSELSEHGRREQLELLERYVNDWSSRVTVTPGRSSCGRWGACGFP